MFLISNAFFSLSSTSGIRTLRLPVRGSKAKMTCGLTPTSPHASFGSSLMSSSAGVGEEKPKLKPWLFVGLGNPGKMYKGTRHNVGFDMVDAIADAEGISVSSPRFKALSGKGYIGDVPVILAKPQTFMNVSGESVSLFVSYYGIPLNQVVVMYDDMDLPFASLRMLPKGGHGGHNGSGKEWMPRRLPRRPPRRPKCPMLLPGCLGVVISMEVSIIYNYIVLGQSMPLCVKNHDFLFLCRMRSIIDCFKGSRDFLRLRIGIGRPPGKMEPASFVLKPFNKNEMQELDFTFQVGIEAVRLLTHEGFDKSATYVNSWKSSEILN